MRGIGRKIRIYDRRLIGDEAEVGDQDLGVCAIDNAVSVQVGFLNIARLATGRPLGLNHDLAVKPVDKAVHINVTGNTDSELIIA